MSPAVLENMNYPNGFPCPAEIQTDFTDHNAQSTWNTPPNVPTAWGHAGLLSNPVSAGPPVLGPWGSSHFFLAVLKSWPRLAMELGSDQLKPTL